MNATSAKFKTFIQDNVTKAQSRLSELGERAQSTLKEQQARGAELALVLSPLELAQQLGAMRASLEALTHSVTDLQARVQKVERAAKKQAAPKKKAAPKRKAASKKTTDKAPAADVQ